MDRCPTGKKGRHDLMAFYVDGDKDVPITLICSQCGATKQYPMTWAVGEGSLDDLKGEDILRLVQQRGLTL